MTSTDGVSIAVHDLGGAGTPLLLSHATGFHGRCYQPLAAALAARFHSISFDYRGHGDTPHPRRPVDWESYGDDATAMATWVATEAGHPIVAFGHSMGGTCLLMAAHRAPSLFSHLVVFEPIVFPPLGDDDVAPPPAIAVGARRRRSTFPSFDEAVRHFSSKPPMDAFTPAALEAYVHGGFTVGDDGAVHLSCLPEIEAATFEMGGHHRTWEALPQITTPVLVLTGHPDAGAPGDIGAAIAQRLPNGHLLQFDSLDHFAPMTHPEAVAEVITAEFSAETRIT